MRFTDVASLGDLVITLGGHYVTSAPITVTFENGTFMLIEQHPDARAALCMKRSLYDVAPELPHDGHTLLEGLVW
jgi:hypothetical protein